jgi:hypothetical protein
MTATAIITCPVCGAEDEVLRHDIRAPLVYACQRCLHEWEIDLADEPSQEEPSPAERPRTPARTKGPRAA